MFKKFSFNQKKSYYRKVIAIDNAGGVVEVSKLMYAKGFLSGSSFQSRQKNYISFKNGLATAKEAVAKSTNIEAKKLFQQSVSFGSGYVAGYRAKCKEYKAKQGR